MTNIMPAAPGAALAWWPAPAGAAPAAAVAAVTTAPPAPTPAGAPRRLKWRADPQARQGKAGKLPRCHHQFVHRGFTPFASVRAAPAHAHSPAL